MMPSLKPSCDSKTRVAKWQKNTYGLLPGAEHSCPGATYGPGGCMEKRGKLTVCYADRLMTVRRSVRAVAEHNTALLKQADEAEMYRLVEMEFRRFAMENERNGVKEQLYRLHWSGDFFSEAYARATAKAMIAHPEIQFWGYTRWVPAVPHLLTAKNLSLYLSVDAVNEERMLMTYDCYHERFPNLHLAVMKEESPGRRYQEQPMIPCPVDAGKMALENSCQKCQLCVKGKNIWFKTKMPGAALRQPRKAATCVAA